ncbi:MAG: exopolysaccharide biosynthesis protein [Pseudomonadota bacterium]|nr:exopolysaccharide biosynthesis protein [Pseudomonadota bacterium]
MVHATDREAAPPRGATAKLEAVLDSFRDKGSMSLGELFAAMEERAFGLVLLVLALPCCLPFVYLLPQIVALPMLLTAGQMALGRASPWLPERLAARQIPIAALSSVVARARPYLRFVEWFAHPRIPAVTGRFGSRLAGLLLLVPTASILVPLPLTNTLPGIGVAIASVGLIERDGLLVLGGLVLGIAWVLALIVGGEAAISMALAYFRTGS